MDKLIYTAMTGASHVLEQQATVSQNLSNTNTPGFRAVLSTFRAVPLVGEGLNTRTFVVDSTVGSDFTPADFQPTGRDMDVAINGPGWIAVQGADGKEAYTRNGSFQLSSTGVLQTRNGQTVAGESGPITIPPSAHVSIGKDGTISVIPDGSQPNAMVVVGRLKLVNPPPQQLDRSADGLFRLKSGAAAPADPNVQVVAGNLEGSNVSSIEMMIDMISLARKFDMQMKMLTSADNNAKSASTIMNVAG